MIGIQTELPESGLSRHAIEEVAREIRAQLESELDYRDAGDLYRVVQWLGGELCYYDLLGSDDHGSIEVRGPSEFTVYLPRQTNGLRDRFTLAHELAHYVLHARQGERPGRCQRSGAPARLEWEANWFAAELLMPADRFQRAWRESSQSARRVAQTFGVSPAAARTRAKALELPGA
ncbi:MAG: ImmA/IrrE family metallo-endopeptidase [Fimbriimonadaceae bacterium]|nr:ImmA/IrrE family metallo-endopeptidase [Fimbriimonadaceae bacterium]